MSKSRSALALADSCLNTPVSVACSVLTSHTTNPRPVGPLRVSSAARSNNRALADWASAGA